MDIPLVLEQLRPGEDWGPCATSISTYEQLAATWRGESPCPTLEEMQTAWATIEAERPAKEIERIRIDAAALLNSSEPICVVVRALARVVQASVAPILTHLGLPTRTWQQLVAAVQAQIDSGNADA